MEMIKINDTSVRTARNFNINNISIEKNIITEKINEFKNVNIIRESDKIEINKLDENTNIDIRYGLGEILTNQVEKNANQNIQININTKTNKQMQINYDFDDNNNILLDNLEIIANENTKSTIVIKYKSISNSNHYHNGILNLIAKEDSEVNVVLINFLNENSNNFIAIQNTIKDRAKVKYTIVDFGGKNSISNYYSNLLGNNSQNILNSIYLGTKEQLLDLNYIGELRGEKSNISIEVQGALKDNSKKHFKGTIDFKKGCKKAKGNENEGCMLLSDTAKSLALPMLLCSEEDVEGQHSTSSGKIGEKELFYIMSRGFSKKEAMKLMVKAKFNKILGSIKSEELREEIINQIDNKLS